MKCGHLSSLKFRYMRKQRGKHATNRMTKTCTEIVENQFRLVSRRATMVLKLMINRVPLQNGQKYLHEYPCCE